ncbi:FAD-dependent oxidoreductase [Deinococcus hopiensis]|uniref:NADPH-dependent 2,4-dienoyl-CoA reductase, sulfur reductase n=1 Tax=Deinococcus hopiensis KR-140 TaxID=695939 RepID=A0A1W1VF51_9DEIO|nr:FAD-dependent oxidoreductase [Deinococcus hopiensis]SMB92008.1 NADPH-dependent 2,4-dienoyl-CoA reductase, sulfur reductase [Deinococcus hopiensis KR-140]
MRIVVVGGVAAGMSAASRARRTDPDATVTVFERGGEISYGACGLPYVIAGQVENFGDLIARTPNQMRERGIDVKVRHEVSGVDPSARTLTVHDRQSGRSVTEPYDRLLIATGSSPVRPDWARTGLVGVHVLRDLQDGLALKASVKGARRACIIGGGYIGLEMAEALREQGLDVTILEKGPEVAGRILDRLDQRRLRAEVEKHGVEVRCGLTVEALTGTHGRVTAVQTSEGPVETDLVVIAIGVRPNTALAEAAGVSLGKTGAVAVNARQETDVEGVYAAGDNCEAQHRVSGKQVYIPLGLTANRMGRVAGVNMTGGDAHFPGIVGTGIFRTFNLGVARTGLTQAEAEALGLDAASVDVDSTDHAGYFPDAAPIHVRMTGERGSGRLLGAQLLGQPHSVKRVDVVAALLHVGAGVEDLFGSDLAYAPPFSTTWDVLLVAADRLRRELGGEATPLRR